jgi:hypothetical protein
MILFSAFEKKRKSAKQFLRKCCAGPEDSQAAARSCGQKEKAAAKPPLAPLSLIRRLIRLCRPLWPQDAADDRRDNTQYRYHEGDGGNSRRDCASVLRRTILLKKLPSTNGQQKQQQTAFANPPQ